MTISKILDSELMQIVLEKRTLGLQSVIDKMRRGKEIPVDSSVAHGNDDSDGIFLPGYILEEDSEGEPLSTVESGKLMDVATFRKYIELGLKKDAATLLYHDHIKNGILLPSNFIKLARTVRNQDKRYRSDAKDRATVATYSYDQYINGYMPDFVRRDPELHKYIGARKKITTAMAMLLDNTDAYHLYAHGRGRLDSQKAEDDFKTAIKLSKQNIKSKDGKILAHPYVISVDASRGADQSIAGTTRIYNLNPNKQAFGVMTFEFADKLKPVDFTEQSRETLFGQFKGKPIYCVLRLFERGENQRVTSIPVCTETYVVSDSDIRFNRRDVILQGMDTYFNYGT